jgi:hypothetical protein
MLCRNLTKIPKNYNFTPNLFTCSIIKTSELQKEVGGGRKKRRLHGVGMRGGGGGRQGRSDRG